MTTELSCPKCGLSFQKRIPLFEQAAHPKTGHLGSCTNCGEAVIFDSPTVVRSLTKAEFDRLPEPAQALLRGAREFAIRHQKDTHSFAA